MTFSSSNGEQMPDSNPEFPAVQNLCGSVVNARHVRATVLSQRHLADGTFAVRLHCPEIAGQILPGQFLMIRPVSGSDPLLGRPFALYDTIENDSGEFDALEFAYHVVGKMTGLMSSWTAGTDVELWGPLGNGFPVFRGKHLLCIGGGIGYTPFLAVARETFGLRSYGTNPSRYQSFHPAHVSFCYGVQSQRHLADLADFSTLSNMATYITSDDGTVGRKGFVTIVLQDLLNGKLSDRPDGVYCCGPEPMMHAVARLCEQADVPCWLSLETPMACGFGACFSCVTRVRTDNGWDYRRTCVEGPIFPSKNLVLGN